LRDAELLLGIELAEVELPEVSYRGDAFRSQRTIGGLAFGETFVAQLFDHFGPTGAVRRGVLAGLLQQLFFHAGGRLGKLPARPNHFQQREQVLFALFRPGIASRQYPPPETSASQAPAPQGQRGFLVRVWVNSTGNEGGFSTRLATDDNVVDRSNRGERESLIVGCQFVVQLRLGVFSSWMVERFFPLLAAVGRFQPAHSRAPKRHTALIIPKWSQLLSDFDNWMRRDSWAWAALGQDETSNTAATKQV